jgi:hypothetical protein
MSEPNRNESGVMNTNTPFLRSEWNIRSTVEIHTHRERERESERARERLCWITTRSLFMIQYCNNDWNAQCVLRIAAGLWSDGDWLAV